jgi:hypothetical protein
LEAQDALPSTIRAGLKIHPDFQGSIQNLQLPDKDASQIVRRLIADRRSACDNAAASNKTFQGCVPDRATDIFDNYISDRRDFTSCI